MNTPLCSLSVNWAQTRYQVRSPGSGRPAGGSGRRRHVRRAAADRGLIRAVVRRGDSRPSHGQRTDLRHRVGRSPDTCSAFDSISTPITSRSTTTPPANSSPRPANPKGCGPSISACKWETADVTDNDLCCVERWCAPVVAFGQDPVHRGRSRIRGSTGGRSATQRHFPTRVGRVVPKVPAVWPRLGRDLGKVCHCRQYAGSRSPGSSGSMPITGRAWPTVITAGGSH